MTTLIHKIPKMLSILDEWFSEIETYANQCEQNDESCFAQDAWMANHDLLHLREQLSHIAENNGVDPDELPDEDFDDEDDDEMLDWNPDDEEY